MSFRILKGAMIAASFSSVFVTSGLHADQFGLDEQDEQYHEQNWNNDDHNAQLCGRLSYDPQTCNRTAGCQYDQWQRQCVRNHVTPGGGGSCWNIYDPVSCNLTPGCYFDRGSNRCAQDPMQPQPNPNPWPQPNPNPWPQPIQQCWQYNNNPYQCQQTIGCSYDRFSNQCRDDGSQYPGGQGQIVSCGSGQYNYATCPLNGYARSVRVLRVVSHAYCIEGQSWGWNSNSIWVDDGCRADFEVRY